MKKTLEILIVTIISTFILLGMYATKMKEKDEQWYLHFSDYKLMEVTYEGWGNQVKVGDLIIVKEQNDYEPNDIVMYEVGTNRDVGRISRTTSSGVVPMKQTSFLEESYVHFNSVIGKMKYCIHGGAAIWKILIHPITTGLLATGMLAYILQKITIKYHV